MGATSMGLTDSMIEQFTNALAGLLPGEITEDIRKNIRAAVGTAMEKMDLVTREEFEVQQAVLQRTREKLEILQKQLIALERELG